MLIVCTHDTLLRGISAEPSAQAWGNVQLLTANQDQSGAGIELGGALEKLQLNEPLCVAAHEVNGQFGDAAGQWEWNADDFAQILRDALPNGYNGPILVFSVAPVTPDFAQGLAASLSRAGGFCGGTVYGFNHPIADLTPFPAPQTLPGNSSLIATKVFC